MHVARGPGLPLLLLLALLAAPPVAQAAPFLQAGVDAARTGSTLDPGPSSDDVALLVALAGSRASRAPPLLVDGAAYLATADLGIVSPSADALVRVGLDDGALEVLAPLPARPWGLASDGERLFVAHEAALDARTLDGALVWSREHPRLVVSPRAEVRCVEPAVRDGTVYVACTEVGSGAPTPAVAGELEHEAGETRVFAAAFDAATGAPRWDAWVEPLGREPGVAPSLLQPRTGGVVGGAGASSHADALSVVGDLVLVLTLEGQLAAPRFWALGADDGRFRWLVDGASSWAGVGREPEAHAKRALLLPAAPTGRADAVFLRYAHLLEAVSPEDADDRWLVEHSDGLSPRAMERAVLALDASALYVGSDSRLARRDAASGALEWVVTMEDDVWVLPGIVLANGTIYGRTSPGSGEGSHVRAFDARDGSTRWRAGPYGTGDPRLRMLGLHFGVGEGVLAAATLDGWLVVHGTTAASIAPLADVSSATPTPGEAFTVDLSRSRAGAQGAPTAFRADWGDGTTTGWQPSPRLTHAFGSEGERVVRVFARNDAGQVSSAELLVHVGGVSPAPAAAAPGGWLAALGAALLLLGAIVGARARRARSPAALGADPVAPGARVLGRYHVERFLGEGGSGRAFLAQDERLGRRTVLKVGRGTARASEAFLAEARALALVRHPHVVAIHEAATVEGRPLLVMEHVEGGSLKERLASGPLAPEAWHRVAAGLLDALAAVHDAGLVHGDVKPANVLLTAEGEAKLADFGVARAFDPDATQGEETTWVPIGTPRYMSPEQARGLPPTARGDLYAAALTLFEAWTGEPFLAPRPNESAAEARLRAARPPSPEARLAPLPQELARWLARALAPDPDERYASAREMRASLEGAFV